MNLILSLPIFCFLCFLISIFKIRVSFKVGGNNGLIKESSFEIISCVIEFYLTGKDGRALVVDVSFFDDFVVVLGRCV
jgi:hypothetical protein